MASLRNTEALGRALKDARARRGWSQGELAAKAGIGQPTISNIERGVGDPSLATLWRILAALELELDVAPRGKRSAKSAWDE